MIICEMQTVCKLYANYNAFRIFYKKRGAIKANQHSGCICLYGLHLSNEDETQLIVEAYAEHD